MFSINSYIDAFQLTKKTLTNKIITDEKLNKLAHNFIDSQTAFAKMLTNNTEEVTKLFIEAQSKVWFPSQGSKS